jgi:branched-subunit amino acid aminotransferase/4-amino-4-deoxychorismate lyase
MSDLISVNGLITPPDQARIPALDRGFLFGDAVFEVFVGFGKKLLDVPRHLARLRQSAEAVALELPWSDAELEFELSALAEQLDESKLYIRLVVTRGNGIGLRVPADAKPNKIVYAMRAHAESASTYRDGLALKRVQKGTTERGAAPKTSNYLASVLAVQKAEREGFQDVLWTNADNEITEASTANVFFIAREGDSVEFVTPPPMSGLLVGITRTTLIELMRRASLPVREHIVYADELARFDEAFMCSTVRGLVPINRIDQHRLHTTRPNAIYKHIERLYMAWVTSEVGHKVDWATGRPL